MVFMKKKFLTHMFCDPSLKRSTWCKKSRSMQCPKKFLILKFIGLLKKCPEGVKVTIWAANFDMSIYFLNVMFSSEKCMVSFTYILLKNGECKKLTLHHITNTNFLRGQLSNFLNITPF